MSVDFENQYHTLGLTPNADWKTVQVTYRRQVNKWHPDRHRSTSKQAAFAEQRFIQLTTAFNTLRDFQKEHRRLPLQRAPVDNAGEPASTPDGSHQAYYDDTYLDRTNAQEPVIADDVMLDASILRPKGKGLRGSPAQKTSFVRPRNVIFSTLIGCFAIMTIALLFKMEQRNSQKVRNEAADVMKNSVPSRFEPSARDVKRLSSKGAFMEGPTPKGAIGR